MSELKRGAVYRACTKKVRYEDEHHANKAAAEAMKRRRVILRVYYCHLCDGCHLTKGELRD